MRQLELADEATIEGVKYVAKETGQNTCHGCVANSGHFGPLCRALPNCTPNHRVDDRNVIWVKAE